MTDDDDWKREADALFPMWWGYWFGRTIAVVAGLQHAFDIANRRVPLTTEPDGVGPSDMFRTDDYGPLWTPGCGFAAIQALVRCQWCCNVYRQIASTTQGDDCCAWIWAETTTHPGYTEAEPTGRVLMQAGYGSCYDTNRYVAIGGNPLLSPNWHTQINHDPVCDRCIADMIDKGWWRLESDGHV